MLLIAMLAEAFAMVVGSLAAGILLCWLCWRLAKFTHHPAWGPLLVAIPIALALAGRLPASQFLDMTLAFAAILAIPFWIEGRAWRGRFRDLEDSGTGIADDVPSVMHDHDAGVPRAPSYRYPAIAACIRDARPAAPTEVKLVAARMWRETFAGEHAAASFALRRKIMRAARQALEGGSS
ncbi:MAG: hypothetical protein ABIS14_07655 [Sphingomonas sp.]